MPPATDLPLERIRKIIDEAYSDYMRNLPPVDRPTEQELLEGDVLFADCGSEK